MKSEKTLLSVQLILTLLFLNLLFNVAVSYFSSLSKPIYGPLNFAGVFEPLLNYLPVTIYYFFLYKILHRRKPLVNDNKLFLIIAATLFLFSFSGGVHWMANMAKEFVSVSKNPSGFIFIDLFDEKLSHIVIFMTTAISSLTVAFLEITRPLNAKLKGKQLSYLIIISALLGSSWFLLVLESSLWLYFIFQFVLSIMILIYWMKKNKLNFNDLTKMPFYLYVFVSSSITLLITITWWIYFRNFPQPSLTWQ